MSHFLICLMVLFQLPSEVGAVYLQVNDVFERLPKVVAKVSSHAKFGGNVVTAEIPGAEAVARVSAGARPRFRVCGVDPTRYKLYSMKAAKNARTIEIWKTGLSTKSKSVLNDSEVQTLIENADGNCFSITAVTVLNSGEYAFSPVGSNEVFAFGVDSIAKR